jgi:Ca2+:H+ antiporter
MPYLTLNFGLHTDYSFLITPSSPQLLGDATEQLSMSLSQAVSALLNATFGNAVELLVGIVALQQNQLRLVQTSMLGSILSNILLVLGCSFAA